MTSPLPSVADPVLLRRILALLAGILTWCGCTPSGFVARRLARAPHAHPQWLAPAPRVELGYPERITEGFPVETLDVSPAAGAFRDSTLPPRLARDPAQLAFRIVPPADYGLRLSVSNHTRHGRERATFDFQRRIPAPPLAGLRQPVGTAVVLHGYALDHETVLPWAFRLGELGWQAVLVDLRGHGRSTGHRISFGPAEAAELQTLLARLRQEGRAPGPTILLGVSMGAAVALRWAGSDPEVASVIAISPYARLADAVEGIRSDFASWVPAGLIRAGVRRLPAFLGVPPEELDPVTVLRRSPVQALFVAGGRDVVATPEAVAELHRAARAGSRLITVKAANHEQLPFFMEDMGPAVDEWLREVASRQTAAGRDSAGP